MIEIAQNRLALNVTTSPRRFARAAVAVLALVVASCAGGDQSVPEPGSALSTSTTTSPADQSQLTNAMETILAASRAFNEGDRDAFDELWWSDASINGESAYGDPEFIWTIDVAMQGVREQIIDSTCHLIEPDVVFCDELHVDDLLEPAGVWWRTSRTYEVVSGRIASFTEVSSNRRIARAYYDSLVDWMAIEHPDLYERAFDFEKDIVWVSIEAIHETVALVDDFVAQSADYPLVPPERLANPELTGTVVAAPGSEVAVYNGGARQIGLVERGLQRYELAGLAPPPVASITFPPHELCSKNSGWAIDNGLEQSIVLCLFEEDMCEDEVCEEVSTLARATLIHELAHVWTNRYLGNATRQDFLDLRGLEVWHGPGLLWAEQGTEHAAEIIMWGITDERLDLFRLGLPSCDELEDAFQLLTGLPSLRDDC